MNMHLRSLQATHRFKLDTMSFSQEITTLFNYVRSEYRLLGGGLALLGCLLGWLLYKLVKVGIKKLRLPLPYTGIINKPFRLFTLGVFWMTITLIKQLALIPPLVSLLLNAVLTFLISLTLYQSVSGIATYLCSTLAGQRGRGHIQLVALMSSLLKVAIIIAGSLLTLRSLNFDITPLLASVSIGGIGFALASQDLFKNLFGSLVIFMDQPFRVGDTIAAKDIEGKVEEIGLRSTRLVTTHDSVTYVPNAQLANAYVDNYGLKKYHTFETRIELAYNIPADLMAALIEGLKKIVANRPYIRKDEHIIYLKAVHHEKLQLLFCIHLEAGTQTQHRQHQEEVQRDIHQLAEQLDIDISLPG